MNVVFVSEGLNESTVIGQPWRHVHEIAKRMMLQGNEVKIVTETDSGSPSKEWIKGVRIQKIKKGRLLFDSDEILKVLNDEKVDIVNWNGNSRWSAVHLWRLRENLRNNVVWTLHSGQLSIDDVRSLNFRELFSLYPFWNNFVDAFCPGSLVRTWGRSSQVKMITTISSRIKNQIESIGLGTGKIRVIRSGVDTTVFHPVSEGEMASARREMGFRDSDVVILYFGPFSSLRGIDTLLASIPRVLAKASSAKFLLLLRQSEKNILKPAYKRQHQITSVSGILDEITLAKYLSLSDVVVLPFGFWPQIDCPLTVLEAMAMGKAVVSTTVGAIPEIVYSGQTGLLVPPKKSDFLSEAIVKLSNDKDFRKTIGTNARKYIEDHHDWDLITSQTFETFRQATG